MKKIVIIILLLICGGLITGFEINQIKTTQTNVQVPVVVLKNSLEVGTILSTENVEIKEIHKDLATENTYRQISDVEGKTLAISLSKGTLLSKGLITEQTFFTPANGHSITALKLSPEAIMCWEVTNGEIIELVHVSLEGQLRHIGEVVVKGYYDQDMVQKNNIGNLPTYVLVEGESHIIDEIIRSRDNGRIEVTKSR